MTSEQMLSELNQRLDEVQKLGEKIVRNIRDAYPGGGFSWIDADEHLKDLEWCIQDTIAHVQGRRLH